MSTTNIRLANTIDLPKINQSLLYFERRCTKYE